MNRNKVVFLNVYRKKRNASSRNLFAAIEGHLAEAGLRTNTFYSLEKYPDGIDDFEPEKLRILRRKMGREEPGDTA